MISIKKVSLILLAVLVIASFFGIIYLIKNNQLFKLRTQPSNQQTTIVKSGKEQIQKGEISKPGIVLEIGFSFKKTAQPPLDIIKLSLKNGYSPKNPQYRGEYEVRLLSQNKIKYQLKFDIPNTLPGDPPPYPGEQAIPQDSLVELDEVNFGLTVPYDSSYQKVLIVDSDGKKITESDIQNIEKINNQPNFNTIQRTNLNKRSFLKFSEVAAQENGDGFLDIAFVSHDYGLGGEQRFNQDAQEFSSYLLTYEPFKSRSGKIRFHSVWNTVDLGCYRYSIISRLIICDIFRVTEQLNSAAVPFDKAVVITNVNGDESLYGGSGGAISVAYNGRYGKQIFVHEFGHTFGMLLDEYILFGNDSAPLNQPLKNCYRGTPKGVVPEWRGSNFADYHKECRYSNWYRSSENSLMRDILAEYFNPVSQQILSEELDFYIGPVTTPVSGSTPVPQSILRLIISFFGSFGNRENGDQNGDGKINELDFGSVYSR